MKPSVWADIPAKVVREDAEKIATHEVRNGRLFSVKDAAQEVAVAAKPGHQDHRG